MCNASSNGVGISKEVSMIYVTYLPYGKQVLKATKAQTDAILGRIDDNLQATRKAINRMGIKKKHR